MIASTSDVGLLMAGFDDSELGDSEDEDWMDLSLWLLHLDGNSVKVWGENEKETLTGLPNISNGIKWLKYLLQF